MLRELQIQELKPIPAQYKAAAAMVTGMGVVIDEANGEVEFPGSATAANIFVVDKEREAKGINNAIANLSDYFTDFVNIASGEFVKLHCYDIGESFATDQYAADLASATYAYVGTDGKWAKSTNATKYLVCGEYNDAGHTLYKIRVIEA